MSDPVRLSAADALEATTCRPRVLVGFDGFLDSITSAVGTRRSMQAEDFEPMRTIDALASRIAGAGGGRSVNIELRERELRAGGNGPLLASALSAQGASVTLIGALGESDAEPIHPAYSPLVERCERAISIAPSARTDALEFDDGKVMFNWSANLDPVDWAHVVGHVGLGPLAEMCAQADVIATINWTNLGGLPSIWRGLRAEVFPGLGTPPGVFVDLSDPAKRTDGSVYEMLDDLRSLAEVCPITLGLNLAEAQRLGGLILGEAVPLRRDTGSMRDAAVRLREELSLHTVLVHTRGMVAGSERDGSAAVQTRQIARPAISTGAGDHFNGGYIAARVCGLGLAESLACGADTASAYVGTGIAPDRRGLVATLRSDLGLD